MFRVAFSQAGVFCYISPTHCDQNFASWIKCTIMGFVFCSLLYTTKASSVKARIPPFPLWFRSVCFLHWDSWCGWLSCQVVVWFLIWGCTATHKTIYDLKQTDSMISNKTNPLQQWEDLFYSLQPVLLKWLFHPLLFSTAYAHYSHAYQCSEFITPQLFAGSCRSNFHIAQGCFAGWKCCWKITSRFVARAWPGACWLQWWS